MKKKKHHQVKASWYYLFWGVMAASVIAGQLYVGSGYREMSNTMEQTADALIRLEMERLLRSQHNE
jgi:hypothetical protein